MPETKADIFEGYTGPALEISDTDFESFAGNSEEDVSPIMCAEPGCTNGIDKPARGRTPKFCPEHKPSRNVNSSARSKSRGSWAKAVEVENALTLLVQAAAAGLMFTALKPDGQTLDATGPQIVHEIVELAKSDKKLQAMLERITAPGKYAPLVWAVAPLVMGVLANHKLLPQFVVDLTPENSGTN
jgi:hypothetical protein